MRSLYTYLITTEEFEGGSVMSTPANTMGMGDPALPGLSDKPGDVEGSSPGSGDQFTNKKRKKKKLLLNK